MLFIVLKLYICEKGLSEDGEICKSEGCSVRCSALCVAWQRGEPRIVTIVMAFLYD